MAEDHIELDPNVLADLYSWHAVIAYLWKNYQLDNELDVNDSDDYDSSSSEDRQTRGVTIENVKIRWDPVDFTKYFKQHYQPEREHRKRLRTHGAHVAMCYNCADNSSRYRVNFVGKPRKKNKAPTIVDSQLKVHYAHVHPAIHSHFELNFYQIYVRFVSFICEIFVKFCSNYNQICFKFKQLQIYRNHPDDEWLDGMQSVQQKIDDVYKRFGNCALLFVKRHDPQRIDKPEELYRWKAQRDDPQTIHAKNKIVDLINGVKGVYKTADELKKDFAKKGIFDLNVIKI